jgi:hypothetical protein
MDVCWSEPQGILLKLGIDGLLSNLFRFQVKYRDMYKAAFVWASTSAFAAFRAQKLQPKQTARN